MLLAQVAILERQVQLQTPVLPLVVSTPPSGGSCLLLSRPLSQGMSGSDVTALQIFLSQDRVVYPEASVTGFFGPLTERALQRWQSARGIVSSGSPATTGWGVAGPRTRSMIQLVSCSSVPTPPVTNIPPYVPPSIPCTMGGITVPAGSLVPFYAHSSIANGLRCEQFMQMRQCVNGVLTGNNEYQYPSCSVRTPLSCNAGGTTVQNGTSQLFYSQASVAFGGSCSAVSQMRTCADGVLSGSSQYTSASCSVAAAQACRVDGVELAHNTSRAFYSRALVGFGENCLPHVQTRACTNGTLSGSSDFNKTSCTSATSTSCSLGGASVANTASRLFYSVESVAFGSTCTPHSLSRTCTNGILSGTSTHPFPTCTVAAASSCVLDGAVVAHNASRTFYTSDTVPFGQSCSATTVAKSRTCTNGVLGGDTAANKASCSVGSQPAPTCSMSVNNPIIRPNPPTNGSVTATWASQNATTGSLSWVSGQNISVAPASGSRTVTYDSIGQKTITLSLTGPGGSGQCSTQVTVQNDLPPTCNLRVTRIGATTASTTAVTNLTYGTSITLSWNSTRATDYASSTSATTTAQVSSGSSTFVPTASGAITYTFNGPGGQCQKSVTVGYVAPTCSVTAVPSTVIYGDSVTLNWTSANADYLTATSSDRIAIAGSVVFPNQTSTTDYVFQAFGRGGQRQCTTRVTVPQRIAVDAPAGGVVVQTGNQLAIALRSVGTLPTSPGAYLELRKSDNTNLGIIATRVNPNGSLGWTVPTTVGNNTITSGSYFIRATLYHPMSACSGTTCTGSAIVDGRADSSIFTISTTTVAAGTSRNLANALAALESALKALIDQLKQ